MGLFDNIFLHLTDYKNLNEHFGLLKYYQIFQKVHFLLNHSRYTLILIFYKFFS